MRTEEVATFHTGAAALAGTPARAGRRRLAPDWFELLVLAAFAAVSMWVVALDVHLAHVDRLAWTGTDGFYVTDQLQYLAWIQEAAKHVLAANLFVLRPTSADYFQPAVVISGGLSAVGVPPWLSLLLWKPVAVVSAFYGVRSYAHRSLDGAWPRRIALLLGLFFGSFTVIYGSWSVLGDMFPAWLSWGYTFGLLAIAIVLFALVAYARAREAGDHRGRWAIWVPGLLGALASLLHPWQGELLILIVIGAELLLWGLDRSAPRRLVLPVTTVILTGAPLLYYEILGRADLSWKLARVASKHSFSLATIVLAMLPLLLPALLAYRVRPRTFLAAATRLWPLAALVIYGLSASSVSATPLHAFEGVTVPLSILAIEGVRRTGLTRFRASPWIVAAVVLAATVPATVSELAQARSDIYPSAGNADFIQDDEQKALRYLDHDREPGGVLTTFYLGEVVPADTGRHTYVGDCQWSEPNCLTRARQVQVIFHGPLPTSTTRSLVQQIGARFVLTACNTRRDLVHILSPLAESEHRFGCATVYTMRSWRY